jgi:hypothetical protein
VVGDRLFFSADDGVSGREPWVYPLAAAPSCQPSETALCLGNGRFRVEASWRLPIPGGSGVGHAVSLTGDTGYFWFFNAANVEMVEAQGNTAPIAACAMAPTCVDGG